MEPVIFSFDVAFRDGAIWLGLVCANSYGSLLATWLHHFAADSIGPSPEQGELEGLIKAIELAQDLGIQLFHLQSDTKDLIEAFQSKAFDLYPQLSARMDHLLSLLASFNF